METNKGLGANQNGLFEIIHPAHKKEELNPVNRTDVDPWSGARTDRLTVWLAVSLLLAWRPVPSRFVCCTVRSVWARCYGQCASQVFVLPCLPCAQHRWGDSIPTRGLPDRWIKLSHSIQEFQLFNEQLNNLLKTINAISLNQESPRFPSYSK